MDEPFNELGPYGSAVELPVNRPVDDPSCEPTSDPEVSAPTAASAVRDVLSALAGKPERDPVTKRFIGPNVAAGTTLERSKQFWSAVEPAKRELVSRVRTDLAVDDGSVETLLGLIDAYAEARLFRTTMFLRLVDQGGPITTKGKARALYRAYLEALDRETRLAITLGLERRQRPVHPLDAVRRAVDEANK